MARSLFRSPTRSLVSAFLFLGLVLGGNLLSPCAQAQTVIEAVMDRFGPVTPNKREQLLRELESHAGVLRAQSAVLKAVVKLVGPAVVHIEANTVHGSALVHGKTQFREEAGSGVVVHIGDDFFVLTNRHVVRGAVIDKIQITLADGRPIRPTQVWTEPRTDVAVMAVDAPRLVAADLGDSDALEMGDFVLAMGSPFGLSHSATFGIVSAKNRRELDLGANTGLELQSFIQTDAAINPGNSGGPLVNLKGQVIGINTAIASNSGGSEGIGFAIPIKMFMFTARQLVETGHVRRAYLGVTLSRDFDAAGAASIGLPGPIGALVTDVLPESPAASSGIQKGDVILRFGNVTIEDDDHLISVVKLTAVGSEVPLVVLRARQPTTLQVRLAEWTDQ